MTIVVNITPHINIVSLIQIIKILQKNAKTHILVLPLLNIIAQRMNNPYNALKMRNVHIIKNH